MRNPTARRPGRGSDDDGCIGIGALGQRASNAVEPSRRSIRKGLSLDLPPAPAGTGASAEGVGGVRVRDEYAGT
jgi:hypothetical protein